jgi:zinc D-Ala-D-Ala carboxypeptidase
MNLSTHFTLAEFTVSDSAARLGLNNEPPESVMPALKKTALGLEAVRVRLRCAPIIITSGYRSAEVNAAVGGQRNSQHTKGEAADFICPRFGTPWDIGIALRDSGIEYDQLIVEFGRWVHISFGEARRHQALQIDRNGTRPMV